MEQGEKRISFYPGKSLPRLQERIVEERIKLAESFWFPANSGEKPWGVSSGTRGFTSLKISPFLGEFSQKTWCFSVQKPETLKKFSRELLSLGPEEHRKYRYLKQGHP